MLTGTVPRKAVAPASASRAREGYAVLRRDRRVAGAVGSVIALQDAAVRPNTFLEQGAGTTTGTVVPLRRAASESARR